MDPSSFYGLPHTDANDNRPLVFAPPAHIELSEERMDRMERMCVNYSINLALINDVQSNTAFAFPTIVCIQPLFRSSMWIARTQTGMSYVVLNSVAV